jgi:PTH1 family peptidyl-tRNA hydrolase
MRLVVGLGNPGPGHARNRHNIGFRAVDAIAARYGRGPFRSRFEGDAAEGQVNGHRVLLFKPMTYMNDSGRAVAAAARFYRIAPADVLVLHDELDLMPGRVRVKAGGGHAGHNGLRSLEAHIGDGFNRVRLGIGHPGDKDRVTGYVLQDFAEAEEPWVEGLVEAVAEALPLLLDGNEGEFMNRVALAVRPLLPAREPPLGGPSGGGAGPGDGASGGGL